MNYELIIKRALQIAWKYKSLWVFGLFVGGMGQINFNISQGESLPQGEVNPEAIFDFLRSIAVPILVLGLTLIVATTISVPALIHSVQTIARGGLYRFMDSFSVGVDLFWRILASYLLLIFVALAGFAVALLPMVISPFLLILTIPLLIVSMIIVAVWWTFAIQVLVIRKTTIAAALQEAWLLLRLHTKDVALIMLILIGLSLGIGIAIGLPIALAYLPMSLLINRLIEDRTLQILVAVITSLPIAWPLGGLVGTFIQSIYTLFFIEVVAPGTLERFDPNQPVPPVPGPSEPEPPAATA